MLVTDNGTNFVSAQFAEFTHRYGIRHVTSVPTHPSSNGMAKRAVKTFKEGISWMQIGFILDHLSQFLFTYQYTPHLTTGASPAELLMGCRLCSPLHLVQPDLEGRVVTEQFKQKRRHDGHAHAREFEMRQAVFARNLGQGSN